MSQQLLFVLVIGLVVGAVIGFLSARSLAVRPAPEPLVLPVGQALANLETRIDAAEQSRASHHAQLAEQVRVMSEETSRLSSALNRSEFRGRWGEAQLRRVVEAAGLTNGVHFVEQASVAAAESVLRPDMLITLADSRTIVVDAKVALDALLSGGTARDHATAVANHIDQLAAKAYWRQFAASPEFVVMFLPAESLLGTALEADPAILERAFTRNIVLATPSTLLALLRTVAMGWRDEALAANAREIHQLGRELHTRLGTLSSHLIRLGGSLDTAVGAYNQAVGSYEGRVLVSSRRMADLGVTSQDIDSPIGIERTTRSLIGVAGPSEPDS